MIAAPDLSGRHKPRILHIVPADGVGGVEVAAKTMRSRIDLPCDFSLLFLDDSTLAGARGWRRLLAPLQLIGTSLRAFGKVRTFDPDVIVCSLWRSVPLALALRWTSRARLAYFVHSASTAHGLDRVMTQVAMRFADTVWADSAATLAKRRTPADRSRVISFVTERLAPPREHRGGARFVSWGRLNRHKGIDRSIRLVALLADRGLDVHYDVFGPDDGERDALDALARELGIGDRVRFPGVIARDDLATIAEQYGYYLQLSRLEGMCMAAVEAMQLGLVPIATPVGEMARYVVPGKTGIVVDPECMKPAVAEIEGMISDPAQWRRRSAAAIGYWQDAPLYADDVCRAAIDLVTTMPRR